MSCPELESLSAFVDGALESPARAQVEQHLSACAACRGVVDELRSINALGRSALQAIHVAPRRVSIRLRPTLRRRLRPMFIAAAAALVLGLGTAVWFAGSQLDARRRARAANVTPAESSRADQINPEKSDRATEAGRFAGSSDEAFERWAEAYRRLRIPLVPMESLAVGQPPPAQPPSPVRYE